MDPIGYISNIEDQAKEYGIVLLQIPQELATAQDHKDPKSREWSKSNQAVISCQSFRRGYKKLHHWCAQLNKEPYTTVSLYYYHGR